MRMHFARQRQTRCYVCKCVEDGCASLARGGPEKMHRNRLLAEICHSNINCKTLLWNLFIEVQHFMFGKVLSLLCTNPYNESGLPKWKNNNHRSVMQTSWFICFRVSRKYDRTTLDAFSKEKGTWSYRLQSGGGGLCGFWEHWEGKSHQSVTSPGRSQSKCSCCHNLALGRNKKGDKTLVASFNTALSKIISIWA